MQSKEKPYVLVVADKIYYQICKRNKGIRIRTNEWINLVPEVGLEPT